MPNPALAASLGITYIPALAAAAWIIAVLALRFRARRKRELSASWPIVAGIFRSGVVSPFRTAGDAINFRLNMAFSYHIGDSEHSGKYVHEFSTEADAVGLMRSLDQGPLYVRYDPVSPSDYVVDPVRDVWVPQAPDSRRDVPVPVTEIGRGGTNPLTNAVSLGQLLIVEAGVVFLLYRSPGQKLFAFLFIAGAHALGAVLTTGCCWWTPAGRRLPTWVGRLALAVVAGGWILAARLT